MIVKFNNREYDLDISDIEVEHARVIKNYASHLTLKGLGEGIAEGDPDALTAAYWLMLKQNGEDHNIAKVSFKPMKFLLAVVEGMLEEAEREAEKAPKEDAPPVSRSKKSASSKATSKS